MRSIVLTMFAVAVLFTTIACGQTSDPVAPAQGNPDDLTRTIEYIPEDYCSLYETSLIAGQYMDLGTVTVSNNEGFLYFDVALTDEAIADGWVIVETHADVYESLDGIPQTKTGNPKIGQFAYDIDSEVPIEDGWTTVYIAVHATLERIMGGEVVQEETGWGEGTQFDGSSWAMWFTYDIGDCCWIDVGLPGDWVNGVHVNPGAGGYWGTTLSNVPAGHDVSNDLYTGWCVETEVTMYPNYLHDVYLYSSYDPDLPDYATSEHDWPRINYILNNKPAGATYTQIQNAIWYFTGDFGYPGPGIVKDMIDDAIANGGDFHPGYGDVWAVICDNWRNGVRQQLTIIEVNPCIE